MRHDLTSLKLFIAVAECGNLTRAAEREHLAVSAVSKRIAELESLIGTTLLQRQARGVSLTPAGQSLLHHARQLMQLVQRMDAELGEYAEGVKGHVRLHVVASALTQFLPEEVESFLGRYPLVNVEMVEHTARPSCRRYQMARQTLAWLQLRHPHLDLQLFRTTKTAWLSAFLWGTRWHGARACDFQKSPATHSLARMPAVLLQACLRKQPRSATSPCISGCKPAASTRCAGL